MAAKVLLVDNQRHFVVGLLNGLEDVESFYKLLADAVGYNLWEAERKRKVRLNLNLLETQTGELLAVVVWRVMSA